MDGDKRARLKSTGISREVFETSRVLIVEDSFDSRTLLKSHLRAFQIQQIDTSENGSELLEGTDPLDYDVIIMGFGLGPCHSGIELLQNLMQTSRLPSWTKVIFITNSTDATAAAYPLRLIACSVLRKPVNPVSWQGCSSTG